MDNFDLKRLHQAIDDKRKEFDLGWSEIAYYNELTCPQLEHLLEQTEPLSDEVIKRLCIWVGVHYSDFIIVAKTPNEAAFKKANPRITRAKMARMRKPKP